jgi:hypothetical protein
MSKRKSDELTRAKPTRRGKKVKQSPIYSTDNDTLPELVVQMQSALKNEVETYNRTKADLKGSYSKIQQIRGALDVLLDLSENYELVPKNTE